MCFHEIFSLVPRSGYQNAILRGGSAHASITDFWEKNWFGPQNWLTLLTRAQTPLASVVWARDYLFVFTMIHESMQKNNKKQNRGGLERRLVCA